MTQSAASLDTLIAKPRTTSLEQEDGRALSECRVQMFGSVAVPPPPGPPPTADYTVPPSLWTFGARGSAGGNYRLPINPNKPRVTIAFTTQAAGKGAGINLQWSSGATSMHTMTVDGHSQQSATPSMGFSTGTPGPSKHLLQPYTTYLLTIDTPPAGLGGLYHINFQNSPY